MSALIKKHTFEFTVNKAFTEVIGHCRHIRRKGMDGSWIGDDIVSAYTQLHRLGYAYSAEAWKGSELIGGLYGVLLGKVFFGESMFSRESNASKFAFIKWVEFLREQGVVLIDCQVYTKHLESLGARMISRTGFIKMLKQYI